MSAFDHGEPEDGDLVENGPAGLGIERCCNTCRLKLSEVLLVMLLPRFVP